MKIFAVVLVLGLVAATGVSAADRDVCYKSANSFCGEKSTDPGVLQSHKNNIGKSCTSKFEHFTLSGKTLEQYAHLHLETSYKYLLLASQFKGYVKERPGFAAHFKALSDRSWNIGHELIKYITRRGGVFKFPDPPKEGAEKVFIDVFDMNEMQVMAEVLDTEKQLFQEARNIHKAASHAHEAPNGNHAHYDPEVAHYLDEEILSNLASSIRKYSGFANDLKNLYVTSKDTQLDTYLFDQYLLKA